MWAWTSWTSAILSFIGWIHHLDVRVHVESKAETAVCSFFQAKMIFAFLMRKIRNSQFVGTTLGHKLWCHCSKKCSTEVSSDSNYLLPWLRLFMWLFIVSECRLLEKSGSVSRLVWATWHLCFCDVSALKKKLSALGSSYSSGNVYRAAWCFISSAQIRTSESVTVCQLWPQCVRPQDIIT